MPAQRQLCVQRIRGLNKRSDRAEIPVSVLYADVRGSTTIAEEVGATEFHRIAQQRPGDHGKTPGWSEEGAKQR
ncbi:MAG TPA: hypothetical protein VF148_11540 [Acidimicrobiia bacterium]